MAKRGMAPRTGARERREVVAAFQASGLSQAEFAQRHGVKVGTLRCWLYSARREGVPEGTTPRFIEVTAAGPPGAPRSGAVLVLRMGAVIVELRELPPPEWLVAVSRGAFAQ